MQQPAISEDYKAFDGSGEVGSRRISRWMFSNFINLSVPSAIFQSLCFIVTTYFTCAVIHSRVISTTTKITSHPGWVFVFFPFLVVTLQNRMLPKYKANLKRGFWETRFRRSYKRNWCLKVIPVFRQLNRLFVKCLLDVSLLLLPILSQ